MDLRARLQTWVDRHQKARAELFEVMDQIGEHARAGEHHGMVAMGQKLEQAGAETEIAHRVVMTLREVLEEMERPSRGALMVERVRARDRRQHAVDVMNEAIGALDADPKNPKKKLTADKAVEAWRVANTAWVRADEALSTLDPVLFGDRA